MSIFTRMFNSAVNIFKGVQDGQKITQILGGIYSNLDQIIIGIVEVGGATTEKLVREAWQEFRNRFGTEVGAFDISKDIPQEIEEKMTNGLADFGECMTLWLIGFYGEKPTTEEFNAVMRSMSAPGTFLADPEPAPEPEKVPETTDEAETTTSLFDLGLSATLRTMDRNPETISMDMKIKALTKSILILGKVNG